MTLTMNDSQLTTLEQIAHFINSESGITFRKLTQADAYQWMETTLVKFEYACRLKKNEKGLIRKYLGQMTGYSRAQVTRLVRQYVKTGRIKVKECERHRFPRKYSEQQVKLLAQTDELHRYPNGHALKKILQRMSGVYGDIRYQALCAISAAHIYNLRSTVFYRRIARDYHPTKPTVVQIGERRKPEPNGKPGYLRVDTVHQGDRDEEKGVYHLNIVDEVTQFEFIGAVEKISERYLLPILEALLTLFPFTVFEFHADNGSEYINERVVKLLNKLLIGLTKSRPRHTNDNALVEGKNGSIIRKWIGYGFIQQKQADALNRFYFGCFNEYLNFHRPSAFATEITDKKGKTKKVYRQEDYQTPYEKLKSLSRAQKYLKQGITFKTLDCVALAHTDNEMAQIVCQERDNLQKEVMRPIALVPSGSSLD